MKQFKGLFLLTCSLFLALGGPVQASDKAKEQRWADQIVGMLIDGEAVWLGEGEDKFLGIYTEETTGEPKGTVIIAHGMGVHPNWQEVIYPLRTRLPEYGWSTLSIQMPVLSNDAEIMDYAPLIPEAAPRIELAARFLKDRHEGPTFLVAHSLGSIMSAAALAEKPSLPVDGFVAIGMSSRELDPHLNTVAYLEKIELPVLDIFGSRDLEQVLSTREKRARATRKAGNDDYRQVQIEGADHFFVGLEDELVRRVRGWLETTAEAE